MTSSCARTRSEFPGTPLASQTVCLDSRSHDAEVAFNHDDTLLASVGIDGTTRIWDVRSQAEVTDPDDPLIAYRHVDRKPTNPDPYPRGAARPPRLRL